MTDLRAYCHQCHHAWTAHDDGTDDGDHCRVCTCDGYVPDFTAEELSELQADLDELERTDPDVAAAATSYDRMVERITGRTLPPRPAASGAERPAGEANDDGLFEHCACCAHSRRSGCGGEKCPCRPAASGGATDGERCECGKRLASYEETTSGLCLRCLNGPVHPILGRPLHSAPVASQADGELRRVLLTHHPIAHTDTGPLKGCRCGQVGLGQDVIAHVVGEVRRALDGER